MLTAERSAAKGAQPDQGKPTVAIVVDRAGRSGWPGRVIECLASDPGIEIVTVIERQAGATAKAGAAVAADLAWKVADAVDELLGRALRSGSSSRDRVADRLAAADTGPAGRRAVGFDAEPVDVVVDLSGSASGHELAGLAKLGAWSLRTGGEEDAGGRPLGFWQCLANEPVCTVQVVARGGPGDEGRVVAAGTYTCYRWSWTINANRLAQRAAWLLVDAVRHAARADRLAAPCVGNGDAPETRRSARQLGALGALSAVLRLASRAVWDTTWRLLREDRWRVLVFKGGPDGRTSGPATVLQAPVDSYWADPFVVRRGGKCYVFVEEYLYAARRGVISYIELAESDLAGGVLEPQAHRLLDAPHHLSYPYLFSYKDELYMIPESGANRTIELWKCEAFPGGWRKVRNLMEGFSAVDTTLLAWGGKWWLFTNLDQSGLRDNGNELHLFHADDPIRGTWVPHPANPVVVDARRARMAGGFLAARDGRPVRCSQVQGKRYGEAVSCNLIEELSETRYAEVPWREAAPVPISPGRRTHHMSYRDGLIVADECTRTWRLMRMLPRWR